MQQRRLRLGDVIDDYCPRERRITNHAVVAMIEDTVKQTRCTTCDADHEYKQAKVPSARRRKTGAAAAQLVEGAARMPEHDDDHDDQPSLDDLPSLDDAPETAETTDVVEDVEAGDLAAAPSSPEVADEETVEEGRVDESDEWPVHRPLIRATLPRPEGQTPERKAPDFTFRPGGGKFDPNRNGQRPRGHRPPRPAPGQPGQGSRFGGQRGPGQGGGGPQGQRHGNRPGQGGGGRPGQGRGPRPGGGRKRGR